MAVKGASLIHKVQGKGNFLDLPDRAATGAGYLQSGATASRCRQSELASLRDNSAGGIPWLNRRPSNGSGGDLA